MIRILDIIFLFLLFVSIILSYALGYNSGQINLKKEIANHSTWIIEYNDVIYSIKSARTFVTIKEDKLLENNNKEY